MGQFKLTHYQEAIESPETRWILLDFPTERGERLAQLRLVYDRKWIRAA